MGVVEGGGGGSEEWYEGVNDVFSEACNRMGNYYRYGYIWRWWMGLCAYKYTRAIESFRSS